MGGSISIEIYREGENILRFVSKNYLHNGGCQTNDFTCTFNEQESFNIKLKLSHKTKKLREFTIYSSDDKYVITCNKSNYDEDTSEYTWNNLKEIFMANNRKDWNSVKNLINSRQNAKGKIIITKKENINILTLTYITTKGIKYYREYDFNIFKSINFRFRKDYIIAHSIKGGTWKLYKKNYDIRRSDYTWQSLLDLLYFNSN
jgi:hypothetical protein